MTNTIKSITEELLAQRATADRLAPIVAPYLQGFADARGSGIRNGPSHLFKVENGLNEWSGVALCGRRAKLWNFEGECTFDFCPRCVRKAEAAQEKRSRK